jgi:hypothetical protein
LELPIQAPLLYRSRFWKGLLHLWDGNAVKKPQLELLHSTGLRPVPLNIETLATKKKHLEENITAVKSPPFPAFRSGQWLFQEVPAKRIFLTKSPEAFQRRDLLILNEKCSKEDSNLHRFPY